MKLPIPGAAELVQAAAAVRDGLGDALGLAPRLLSMLDDTETLLARVTAVVGKIEMTVDRADALIASVGTTDLAAARVLSSVESTTSRGEALLDLYEGPARQLAPAVRIFADALDPDEVSAMVGLVDRLPVLLKHLDEDVLPILTTLDRVAPDLHQLLEIAQDLQVALGGLPGMGWLRKRAEKEDEEAEELAREIEAETSKPRGKPRSSRSKPPSPSS